MAKWEKGGTTNRKVPKFWNLIPLDKKTDQILRIPVREETFKLVGEAMSVILESNVLRTTSPEFPIMRKLILRMTSPLWVPFIGAIDLMERQKKSLLKGGIHCSSVTQQRLDFT